VARWTDRNGNSKKGAYPRPKPSVANGVQTGRAFVPRTRKSGGYEVVNWQAFQNDGQLRTRDTNWSWSWSRKDERPRYASEHAVSGNRGPRLYDTPENATGANVETRKGYAIQLDRDTCLNTAGQIVRGKAIRKQRGLSRNR
jgi:hypothetical protein